MSTNRESYQDVACTALFVAAYKGNADSISVLLPFGVDVDSKGSDGVTCLAVTARENHPECVRYLLSQGANVNYRQSPTRETA